MNSSDLNKMVEAIRLFHEKHGFDIGTKDKNTMLYRMNLLMEEMGEISQCLTKGKGDIEEEHADLFILLLGNCITMDIDLQKAFWGKYDKIMKRESKIVDGVKRVSEWKKSGE